MFAEELTGRRVSSEIDVTGCSCGGRQRGIQDARSARIAFDGRDALDDALAELLADCEMSLELTLSLIGRLKVIRSKLRQ